MKRSNVCAALVALLIAPLAAGCGADDPAAPATDAPAAPLYPLAVGNQWTYDRMASVQFVKPDDPEPDPPTVTHATELRSLVSTRTIGEVDYIVEERLVYADGFADTLVSRVLLRQDDDGLYEAPDPDEEMPPGVATADGPPGVEEALRELRALDEAIDRGVLAADTVDADSLVEKTRLHYPLEPGTEWILSEDPLQVAVVEESEVLELPSGAFTAFRIRIEAAVLGEDGWAYVWYGACGRVKRHEHIELRAKEDPDSDEFVIVIMERKATLSAVVLADSGACAGRKKKDGVSR